MLKEALKQVKISLMLLIIFTLLTGIIYPFFVTSIAQLFFPWQANGSLVSDNNKIIGSRLIGQSFDPSSNRMDCFWSRPSATSPFPYNAGNSSGSNMGPSNPDFLVTVQNRINLLHQNNFTNHHLIPVDLVTASGSGLDPDISPYAAFYQVPRIAKFTRLSEQEVANLIKSLIKSRTFAILGEPRINVLELNMALNKLRNAHARAATRP